MVKNGESKNNKNIVNNLSMAMVLYGNQKFYSQNWYNDTFKRLHVAICK